jgi:hypothetical protein
MLLKQLHTQYGHIQEIIIQNFRWGPASPAASASYQPSSLSDPQPNSLALTSVISLWRHSIAEPADCMSGHAVTVLLLFICEVIPGPGSRDLSSLQGLVVP